LEIIKEDPDEGLSGTPMGAKSTHIFKKNESDE